MPEVHKASFPRERLSWEMYIQKYFTSLSSLSAVYSFKENSGSVLPAFLLLVMEEALTL